MTINNHTIYTTFQPDISQEIQLLKKYIERIYQEYYETNFEEFFQSIDLQSFSEENFLLDATSLAIKFFAHEAENIQFTYQNNIVHLAVALKLAILHQTAAHPENAWFWLFIANKSRGTIAQIDHYNLLETRLSQRSESARRAALVRHKNTVALKEHVLKILTKHKPDNGWPDFKTAMHSVKSQLEALITQLGIMEVHAGKKSKREADSVIDLFYKWRHNDPQFKIASNQFVKTSRKLRESIKMSSKPTQTAQEHLQAMIQQFSRPSQ